MPESFHADARFPVSVKSLGPRPRELFFIQVRVDGALKNATVERFNNNSVPVSGFTGFV